MEDKNILTQKVILKYKFILMDTLHYSFPALTAKELSDAIDYSILKRCKDSEAYINNNYTKEKKYKTLMEVLEYIMECEPIITSSGVLFKKHKDSDNPLSKLITKFLETRSSLKKEMFKYPKGSEEFEKYNLLQLLEKVNANAIYGILGQPTSFIYNLYIAEAITRQGRSYISCSIMLFESLLSNNVKFNNLNEVITFLYNVVNEKDDRKFIDNKILDRDVTLEEAFYKVMNTVDMTLWIPTEKEMTLVMEYMQYLSNEDLNRIYYKNNLYSFCDLPVVSDLIISILQDLNVPFLDPNSPPDEIKEKLDSLLALIKEYVYYKYPYIDKLDRIDYMQRDIVIITDTDSTIISFDAWYRFVLNKVYNIDMPIKHEKIKIIDAVKADEFGDLPNRKIIEKVEPRFDYDFYTDEVVEIHRTIEPVKIIPQDLLKYAIINIIAYICSDLIVDYLAVYSKYTGSYEEGTKCRMIMKNEFYFLRTLVKTGAKKNYANIQLLQEGQIIPEGNRMDIKGLPLKKTTVAEKTRNDLQDILFEEILNSKEIDQVKIMKRLKIIEKQIYNSIMNKETYYYIPKKVSPISTYKDPMRQDGVKAILIYNALKDEDKPEINLEENNKIIKIPLKIMNSNLNILKEKYKDVYDKLMALESKTDIDINVIGFPMDEEIPDWVLELVDVNKIINANLTNFPIDSVGISLLNNDKINFSNIVQL